MSTMCDIVVIGAGPGGYAAAFYAADLGYRVVLIEKDDSLGGVCLNRGCIPSKSLLHATGLYQSMKTAGSMGIHATAELDINQLREWKSGVVRQLASGVSQLAASRQVQVIQGRAHFESSDKLRVNTSTGQVWIEYKKAIIATGSRPAMPSAFDLGSQRIMTSTEALNIARVPDNLLIIGGGYIGMELGVVYARMGSAVHVVEATGAVLAGADADLVRPVEAVASTLFASIQKSAKVIDMKTQGEAISVVIETQGEKQTHNFDAILVAVGRSPNTDLGLENTRVKRDDAGFIQCNAQQQTDDASIFAIGDCAGGLLLAHKASKEARIAVDAIAGRSPMALNTGLIPAVVFTDPEIAWVGLTETEAKATDQSVKIARFPWRASGRAMSIGRTDGLTKLIIDPQTNKILGAGIVGQHAGDLISEITLAIGMQATVEDIAAIIHPHPTLSETVLEASEVFLGHCTHLK